MGCHLFGSRIDTIGEFMADKKLEDYLYYEEKDPDLKIYSGDCMEIMKLLDQVDIVMTDPPYGMNFQSNHRKEKHDVIHGDDELPIETIKFALAMANRGGVCVLQMG